MPDLPVSPALRAEILWMAENAPHLTFSEAPAKAPRTFAPNRERPPRRPPHLTLVKKG